MVFGFFATVCLFYLIFSCDIFWSYYFPSPNSSQNIPTPRYSQPPGKRGSNFLQWSDTGFINHTPGISLLPLRVITICYGSSTITLLHICHILYVYLYLSVHQPINIWTIYTHWILQTKFYSVFTQSLIDPREISVCYHATNQVMALGKYSF